MAKALEEKRKPKSSWKQDPERVKAEIIKAAMAEFAQNGLSGAKIDDISARTSTSKRMIYYYFEDKEALYLRALEAAYSKVRQGEEKLDLDGLPPVEALERLVAFTFDHHRKNPDFIRMVMIENVHHAEFLNASQVIRGLNKKAVGRLETLIERGQVSGDFRDEIDPVELHWQISAISVFNVSNRPTFSSLFGKSLYTREGQDRLRARAVSMVLGDVLKR
ncbi:TetR/AcrR family transcriptional regulator [Maritimibacter dapengensis]|uniref:TetR/AcrR family transcriptional regulator n=1 Tax=Maritimibacter dapengensis TaxID=2836868 RepID=UPI002105EA0F|nr:TetR/AcrR family transcriptional regulator [Maritimibacter dapengensis]